MTEAEDCLYMIEHHIGKMSNGLLEQYSRNLARLYRKLEKEYKEYKEENPEPWKRGFSNPDKD